MVITHEKRPLPLPLWGLATLPTSLTPLQPHWLPCSSLKMQGDILPMAFGLNVCPAWDYLDSPCNTWGGWLPDLKSLLPDPIKIVTLYVPLPSRQTTSCSPAYFPPQHGSSYKILFILLIYFCLYWQSLHFAYCISTISWTVLGI